MTATKNKNAASNSPKKKAHKSKRSANVPGQFAVQTALGGRQSIEDLIRPGGRLYETRRAILESMARFHALPEPR